METEEIKHELDAHKEFCLLSGCLDDVLLKTEFEKEKGEIMKCIEKMKSTMQTKSHYLWEIAKVLVIPLVTAIMVYYTGFVKLETEVKIMKALIAKHTGIDLP